MSDFVPVRDAAELRQILGPVADRPANKERTRLHELDRQWLAACPFFLMATSDANGSCDVSPKGDPVGAIHVVDDRTLVLADRPGNRRADSWHNVLSNPHVGLIFLIPGRGDTLRINGRARLVKDAPCFDQMVVSGHRPTLALWVEIEAIYHHCSKAFLRSKLWDPDSWNPGAVPRRSVISKTLEPSERSLDELDQYYGQTYAERLYTTDR